MGPETMLGEIEGETIAAAQLRRASEEHADANLGDLKEPAVRRKTVRFGADHTRLFYSENPGYKSVPDRIRQHPMGNYIDNNIDYVWRWDRGRPREILSKGFSKNTIEYKYRLFGKRTVSASMDKDGADNYLSMLSDPISGKKRVGINYHLYKINVKNLPVVDLLSNNNESFMEKAARQISLYHSRKDFVESYIRRYNGGDLFLTREAQVLGGIDASRIEYIHSQHIFTYI